MYTKLKRLFLFFFPEVLITFLSPLIRSLLALYYKGTEYQCILCNTSLRTFVVQKNHPKDLLCPKCGSLPRTRHLFLYLKNILPPNTTSNLLHFSPHKELKAILKTSSNINYTDTDYESKSCSQQYDITNIDSKDGIFSHIICYHVLEHIKEDLIAMQELYRVLKAKGTLLVQVPLKQGESIEEPKNTEYSPKKRLELYAQEDHVRIYGKNDFINRLKQTGFTVRPHQPNASKEDLKKYGIWPEDTIYICTK